MKTDKWLRSVSDVTYLVFFFISLFVYAGLFNIAKDLAILFLALGTIFMFLVTHYLCLVGQATRSDFGLLIAISITSLFLGVYYWPDGTEIIEVISFVLITILLPEYQWPDWLGRIRERLIKKET